MNSNDNSNSDSGNPVVTIGVQKNGKTIGTIRIDPAASEDTAVSVATKAFAAYFGGQTITRVMYRPGRIINICA